MTQGAPQAHLTSDVVSLRVDPKRFWGIIRMCFFLGLFFGGGGLAIILWGLEGRGFGVVLFLLGSLFLYFGVMNFGIARARPVALRLDADGASGYYVPSMTWDEVARVGVSGQAHGDLAFEIKDVAALRARQKTAMRRWALKTSFDDGWHILVPQSVLDVPVHDLAGQAQAFLDKHREMSEQVRPTGL